MHSRLFTGLFLIAFHVARCDCAPGPPGREFPLLDFPIDVSLEELEHTVKDLADILADAQLDTELGAGECKDERDCSFIVTADEDYCRRHKDSEPVKQCRKTCGFCGKAPVPAECKDERDCTWIVTESEKLGRKVEDYCKRNAGTEPVKQCPKTCGTCKAPSPPECKDERDCSFIATALKTDKDYCQRNADKGSIKQCRSTCGFCGKAPSPTVENVKRVDECKDERNCSYVAAVLKKYKNFCELWKDSGSIKKCRKTCGLCGKAPSPTECKDERDCSFIVTALKTDKDYCQRNADTGPIKQCLNTCGFCGKAPSPPECKDERDCSFIVTALKTDKDYCQRNADTGPIKQCRRTCGFCGKAPSPTDCTVERGDCYLIKEKIKDTAMTLEQYCEKYENDPAVKQCPETCGKCLKPPSPPTKQPTQKPIKPTTAPKPTQQSGETPIGFQRDCLAAHNNYRSIHRVPSLKWSAELARDAQDWANHLADTGAFDHDPTLQSKGQGENLYYTTFPLKLCGVGEKGPDCMTCGDVVDPWYDEEADYNYGTGEAKTEGALYLHFTQIVWKATKELGMAIAVANNRLVAVARYSSAGNVLGEFQENVLPPDFP